MNSKPRDGSIEAGLELLAAISLPGQRWTQTEIATACGTSRGYVFMTEQAAMRKIREKLRRKLNLSWKEFVEYGDS